MIPSAERVWHTARRLVVKVGGAILDSVDAREAFAASVAAAQARGQSVIVIHGGGAQVSRLTDALGLPAKRVRGLRVTDEPTALAAVQVLRGQVNAELTAALVAQGVTAIGLSGIDAGLFEVRQLDSELYPGLGQVGEVVRVKAKVLKVLLAHGFTPVIATMAAKDGAFYNVNADAAVAPVAAAMNADAVLFLSDVSHVLDGKEPIFKLSAPSARGLMDSGVIQGGMIPKVEAALDAARALSGSLVRMASGLTDDPISNALSDASHGTTFVDSDFAAADLESTHA